MTDELISLQKLQVAGWIYLLCLTLGSWLFASWSFAWAVLAGGIISILSFVASQRDIVSFFETIDQRRDERPDQKKVKKFKAGFILKFWFRIGVIGVVLLLLIKVGNVNVFGLILGLSTVVFTVTVTALRVAGVFLFRGRR